MADDCYMVGEDGGRKLLCRTHGHKWGDCFRAENAALRKRVEELEAGIETAISEACDKVDIGTARPGMTHLELAKFLRGLLATPKPQEKPEQTKEGRDG